MRGKDSDGSDRSDRSKAHRRLRPSGGYRDLRSFQVATVIYDATVSFCDRFVDKRSRTHDQMVQAARSGRQNIAEGSRAAATSSQTEPRLVNVRVLASMSCCWTMKIFCDSAASASGKKRMPRRVRCARWGCEEIRPIGLIGPIRWIIVKDTPTGSMPATRQSSPTPCSA